MAISFIKPRLMRWSGNAITDHNRSPLSIDVERIEKQTRMANGTLRKYVIADKRTFSCSWEMLPRTNVHAVDGYWAGESIETFYNATPGSFALQITNGDSTTDTYTVVFSEFSKEIVKRGAYDMWNVNVSMEEV